MMPQLFENVTKRVSKRHGVSDCGHIGTTPARPLSLAVLTASAVFLATSSLQAAQLFAVVPTKTIYPGEIISAGKLEELEVTNPRLKGNFAQSIGQVEGKLSRRTLLPGRAIFISALREPFAVEKGTQVQLIYERGSLRLSALAMALQDASAGEVIRVRNSDSGRIIAGTVLEDGSVRVLER